MNETRIPAGIQVTEEDMRGSPFRPLIGPPKRTDEQTMAQSREIIKDILPEVATMSDAQRIVTVLNEKLPPEVQVMIISNKALAKHIDDNARIAKEEIEKRSNATIENLRSRIRATKEEAARKNGQLMRENQSEE